MLTEFCSGVQKRLGSGWSDIIVALLPVVIEMISTCFNKSSELREFAEGQRNGLQLAGLRNKCRRVVQERGVRGPIRVALAAGQLYDAVLEELDATAQRMTGQDAYEQAFEEALSV